MPNYNININVIGKDAASGPLRSVAGALGSIGEIASGIVAADVFEKIASSLTSAATAGIDSTRRWHEQIDRLHDQFGMTGPQASKFAFAMNRVGLSIDEGSFGLNFFTRGLDDVNDRLKKGEKTLSPFQTALAKLGVSAFDSRGKMKSFEAILPEIMDHFQKLPPGINASALAMDLFGARGGSRFLDFLREGSSGLDEANKKTQALGLSMSTDVMDATERFGFALNEMGLGLEGMKNQIGVAMLPVLQDLVNLINKEILPSFLKWFKEHTPALKEALKSLSDWIQQVGLPALKQLGDWFLKEGLPALKQFGGWVKDNVLPVIKQLMDLIKKPPSTAGLTAAFTNILKILQPLLEKLSKFWEEIEPKITKAWLNIQKVTKQAWDFIWGNVIKPVVDAITKFIEEHHEEIEAIIKGVWKEIQGVVKVAWATISGIIKIALDILGGDMDAAAVDWKEMMKGVWDGIKLIISGALDIIKNTIGSALGAIWTMISNKSNDIMTAITSPFSNALATIQNINWGAIGGSIVTAITNALNAALGAGSVLLATIQGFVNSVGTSIAGFFASMSIDNIRNAIALLVGNAMAAVQNVGYFLWQAWNAAVAIVQKLIDSFWGNFSAMVNALGGIIGQAINNILDILGLPHWLNPLYGQFGVFAPMRLAPAMAGTGGMSTLTMAPSYNLTIYSQARTEQVVADFMLMKALAGT